ncbi:MAG: hypothetical protein ACYTFY_14690 [Planctomycetota bacterium]|jgi:histidinol phosphatase-like PHP family hydrolase
MLLKHDIDVLAHPFRWYRRNGLDMPPHLFADLAEMLAGANVSAEINMHTNNPDPAFFKECIAKGVKIALGTDSHNLKEVAEITPHLRVLEAAGAGSEDLKSVLFTL